MRDDLENPMVRDSDRDRAAEAREAREQRCYRMHISEFLDAIEAGERSHVSRDCAQEELRDVVADLLCDEPAIAGLLDTLRVRGDVAMYLARLYAGEELARYVDEGSL